MKFEMRQIISFIILSHSPSRSLNGHDFAAIGRRHEIQIITADSNNYKD